MLKSVRQTSNRSGTRYPSGSSFRDVQKKIQCSVYIDILVQFTSFVPSEELGTLWNVRREGSYNLVVEIKKDENHISSHESR
jgi:hypothetical protein